MTAARLLDCGHPDDTPDVAHNDHNQHVCADCCPTCNPRPHDD